MTTRPRGDVLDMVTPQELVDMAIARASDLPREQHALMSAGGAPEQTRSVWYEATGGTPQTYNPSVRVPPGVTAMDVEILLSGNGTVEITSPAGDTLFRTNVVYDSAPTPDHGVQLRTDGVTETGYDTEGTALVVLSAVAWEETDVDLTVVVTPDEKLTVYYLSFAPIHVPR